MFHLYPLSIQKSMENVAQYQSIKALVVSLDFQELARLERKALGDLTESELKYIGLTRFGEVDGDYYYCKDMHGAKIYFERQGDAIALRGKDMRKMCPLRSTGQLIVEALFKWRLKGFGMRMANWF
jgi:hypothetical protein